MFQDGINGIKEADNFSSASHPPSDRGRIQTSL